MVGNGQHSDNLDLNQVNQQADCHSNATAGLEQYEAADSETQVKTRHRSSQSEARMEWRVYSSSSSAGLPRCLTGEDMEIDGPPDPSDLNSELDLFDFRSTEGIRADPSSFTSKRNSSRSSSDILLTTDDSGTLSSTQDGSAISQPFSSNGKLPKLKYI